MTMLLPTLRVGDPLRHDVLTVFPLFGPAAGEADYRLSEVALADESVSVEELSEGGSVPELAVMNGGDLRVLFLEGEQLVGAKQNRVLNTSILVPAHSRLTIPVSCVEAGRWGYRSRKFGASESSSPRRLRYALRRSVNRSLERNEGYRSDQGAVWDQVALMDAELEVGSPTRAMEDSFQAYSDRIQDHLTPLSYVDGATGLAIAVGDSVSAIEAFDQPATCRSRWDRLLSAAVLEAMTTDVPPSAPAIEDAEQLLASASALPWAPVETVGEGQAYRAESPEGELGAVLSLGDRVVHWSVITAL